MNEHQHHDSLIESISKEYSTILEKSTQGIYIYLDDTHKVCNEKFATLLGYESAGAWAKIDTSFPSTFVADDSQETLVSAYQDAMEHNTGSSNKVTWKKKDGSTVNTEVLLAPIVHQGHLFALHFVSSV